MAYLEKRVKNNLNNSGTEDNILCEVCRNGTWEVVTSGNIFSAVRTASKALKLHEKGIYQDMIGAHSLQAGGAMSLKIIGYKD